MQEQHLHYLILGHFVNYVFATTDGSYTGHSH